MAYIGKQPLVGNFIKLDAITASATDTYNLLNDSVAYTPQSAMNCIVSLNGVIQAPITAYTIVGTTIVFSTTLSASDTIDFIVVLGDVLDVGTVSDDTISTAKIKDLAVTAGKLAATQDLSTKTITLPASVSGLGTGITNAQLAGSIADAKITGLSSSKLSGALPAISGASLTSLNATNIGSGTVPTARLGSGTASSSTVLYGDQTYKAEPGGGILKGASIVVKAAETFTGTAPAVMSSYDLAFQATAADSKLWLSMSLNISGSATSYAGYFYNSTDGEIASPIGDASGSSIRSSWRGQTNNNDYMGTWTFGCWYEPGNTNNNTYQIFGNANAATTMYLNRAGSSVDSAAIYYARTASTFTILEYAAGVITLSGY